jgi:hypothetical protein
MSVYEETQAILNTYKIQANKSLGQNFLIDDCVIEKIIESSNIEKEDLIIEMATNKIIEIIMDIIMVVTIIDIIITTIEMVIDLLMKKELIRTLRI